MILVAKLTPAEKAELTKAGLPVTYKHTTALESVIAADLQPKGVALFKKYIKESKDLPPMEAEEEILSHIPDDEGAEE